MSLNKLVRELQRANPGLSTPEAKKIIRQQTVIRSDESQRILRPFELGELQSVIADRRFSLFHRGALVWTSPKTRSSAARDKLGEFVQTAAEARDGTRVRMWDHDNGTVLMCTTPTTLIICIFRGDGVLATAKAVAVPSNRKQSATIVAAFVAAHHTRSRRSAEAQGVAP